MASRRITRTRSFSSYLASINDEVSILKSRSDTTGLGVPDGAVTDATFADEISLVSNGIHSSNYIPNYAGWRISGGGVAEFSDVFVRGDINAYSGTIGYWNISTPNVSRTFGTTTLNGTFLESSAIGDTDNAKTSGTYVGLFKSFRLDPASITEKYRKDNIATITSPDHPFIQGDSVYVLVDGDSTYGSTSTPVYIISTTKDTISYINNGDDYTNVDGSDNPIDHVASGNITLYTKDIAGLYLRDYSKNEFDYGYFSNQGISYVSAEDINVIENPSFEYNGSYSAVSWSAGTGLTLASKDFSALNFKNSSSFGGGISWGSPAVSTYLTGNIDYAAGNVYNIYSLGKNLYLGLTVFPNYSPATNMTISSIETYNLTTSFTSASANDTTITYTGSNLAFSAGQYITVSGYSNSRFNITNQKIATANATTVTVTLTGAVVSTETATKPVSTGLLKVSVATGTSTLISGDTAFLDVDAGVFNNTYGEIDTYYVPHTIADGSHGYTYTVAPYPSPTTSIFYLQTEYGAVASTGTGLTLESHVNSDGITYRGQKVYEAYNTALDLSAITFTYSTGSVSTPITDVLSTGTAALWSSNSKNKYLFSSANDYMLGWLDAAVDVPAMTSSIQLLLDGAGIGSAYLNADPTGYASGANIKINIPGWLVSHDGAGIVPISPTKIPSIGYIADNVYLSTASNFFYGADSVNYRWYAATDTTVITDPSQASIEGTKAWLDVNLESQTASIDYFDFIALKNSVFSNSMIVRPSFTVKDDTTTIVKFPDSVYETTTITGGKYQYFVSGTSYTAVSPALRLLTGERSSGFELSARSSYVSNSVETFSTGAIISGIYDQNDGGYTTIYTGSNKFIWSSYPSYVSNEQLASVIFESDLATFRQKILGLGGFTGSTLRLTASAGLTLTSTSHALQLGDTLAANLRLDSNEMQAVSNTAAALLYLNRSGGDIQVGNTASTITIPGLLRLSSATQYSLSSSTHPFQVGLTSGDNVRIDNNGIQAVSNGAVSNLNINTFGGNVSIGNTSTSTLLLNGTANVSVDLNVSGSISTDGSITRTILAGGGSTAAVFTNTGALVRTSSSARYKQDILDAEYSYSDIISLRPRQFRLKDEAVLDSSSRVYSGFIAEELDQIETLKVFVNYLTLDDGSKIPDSIQYGEMVSALVSAIKHQDILIKSLSSRLDALEGK